ncbi:MAG TPA: chemotaxis protein CheA [Terriglobales bacterium]|jgi:two-component system chemotaxis sensor kinase CheA|nr:chemotaxis protein CheA [Terriglobales bacterium]
MSELRQLFFESAGELVQKLNDEAMQLEKSPGDAETARSLRRTVHTLKGDAAACGFRELSELSHEFEDVLSLENTSAAASVPEIALRAADVFAALLEAYRNETKLPSIQALRADIARLARNPKGAIKAKNKKKKPATTASRWSEYEQLAITRATTEGKRVHHVLVQVDPQCLMPIAARQMIQLALAEMGEVLALYPLEGSLETIDRIEAALASDKSGEQIRAKCCIPTIALNAKVSPLRMQATLPVPPSVSVAEVEGKSVAPKKDREEKDHKDDEIAGVFEAAAIETPPVGETPVTPAVPGGPDNLLRVDAERIDSVLNLVGELILAKSMLQQALLEFGQRFPKDALRGKFADAMAFQGRVLNDLQHSVMKIRMVPVDQLFRRFPRIVRDVGRQSGKEVELIVRGGQTDLDKSILDAIAEPLTHLVRNAIGHGIETAEQRIRAGKRPQGTLRLAAYHQGNQVVIEVSDDGGGIDADKVRKRALSLGLLDAERAARISESETLDLILQPGFSTAEEITELSGRGVGLDVVQSVLGRLKGTVQIETSPGRGTTFRLRLPLTLAIIRALLFRVDQRLYALPLNAVAEITRTVEEEIHQVEHYDVLQLRNGVLPLLRLGSKPPSGPETARRKVFVLVINSGDRKFGVMVDGLEGEDELVIKALDDQSITTDLVSGASILGDGRVVLILNMIALMERFTRRRADVSSGGMSGLLSTAVTASSTAGESAAHGMQARSTAGGQA